MAAGGGETGVGEKWQHSRTYVGPIDAVHLEQVLGDLDELQRLALFHLRQTDHLTEPEAVKIAVKSACLARTRSNLTEIVRIRRGMWARARGRSSEAAKMVGKCARKSRTVRDPVKTVDRG